MTLQSSFDSRNTGTVFWWLLTLAWAVQIFFLSTSGFSSYRTESLLLQVLASCQVYISPETLDLIHITMRKLSHGMLFAVLSLLVYRALGGQWLSWRTSTARRAIAAAALYGMADEFHQLFVPDRGASLFDCGVDTAGAALAMLLLYAFSALRRKRGVRMGGNAEIEPVLRPSPERY